MAALRSMLDGGRNIPPYTAVAFIPTKGPLAASKGPLDRRT